MRERILCKNGLRRLGIRELSIRDAAVAVAPVIAVLALVTGYRLPDLFAVDLPAIDVEDPVDRRVIDFDPATSMSSDYRAAKEAEAAAMLRWFEARLRMIRVHVGMHAIEHEFNQANLDRLSGLTGSIAGKDVLEARKQTQLDDLIDQELRALVEMAEADVAAARARLDSIRLD